MKVAVLDSMLALFRRVALPFRTSERPANCGKCGSLIGRSGDQTNQLDGRGPRIIAGIHDRGAEFDHPQVRLFAPLRRDGLRLYAVGRTL